MVTSVHCYDLWQSHMAFINERDEILREIIYKAERAHSLASAVKIARVVFYSRAISHLLDELQIVLDSLFQSLGFQMLADFMEIFALCHHIILNLTDSFCTSLLSGDEITCRVDRNLVELFQKCSAHRVNDRNLFHLITEELDAYSIFSISDADVHCVASDSECSSLEICLSATVECIDQLI